MKVIDLLNKIANGEETPKRFKIQEFELNDCYINETDYLEVEQTPYNERIIRIKSKKKN